MTDASQEVHERMQAVRDELCRIGELHNQEAHGGRNCRGFAIWATVLVAHTLGIHTEEQMEEIAEDVYEMALRCPCHDKNAPKEPGK